VLDAPSHTHAADVIKVQHWTQIADFLGMPQGRVRETFRLHLALLHELGYELVTRGANTEVRGALAPPPPPPPPPPRVEPLELMGAVEDALAAVTARRVGGERLSDQAEAREITRAVLKLLRDK
jgi:hypothetical protein